MNMLSEPKIDALLAIVVCLGSVAGCHSVSALNAEGNTSERVATLSNSGWRGFSYGTNLHGGTGIIKNQLAGASIEVGKHSYQAIVSRRSKLAILILQDMFYLDAICAFNLDARAGHRYTLGDVLSDNPEYISEATMYRARIEIQESTAGEHPFLRLIEAECTSVKNVKGAYVPPSSWLNYQLDTLCSKEIDCERPGGVCRIEPGFTFGVCTYP